MQLKATSRQTVGDGTYSRSAKLHAPCTTPSTSTIDHHQGSRWAAAAGADARPGLTAHCALLTGNTAHPQPPLSESPASERSSGSKASPRILQLALAWDVRASEGMHTRTTRGAARRDEGLLRGQLMLHTVSSRDPALGAQRPQCSATSVGSGVVVWWRARTLARRCCESPARPRTASCGTLVDDEMHAGGACAYAAIRGAKRHGGGGGGGVASAYIVRPLSPMRARLAGERDPLSRGGGGVEDGD
ncbi:hypothetical protein BC628DRAFT_195093 [Trametes gibbosa]|nr:hypothetical protein BC628DRAFT_195093 [Trametes gibbosa]